MWQDENKSPGTIRGFCVFREELVLRRKLAQDVLQDAAVLVVEDFLRCVDADLGLELLRLAVGCGCLHLQRLAIGEFRVEQ